MTKLCKTRSSCARQSISPERAAESLPKLPPHLVPLILHALLCTAALLVGFSLSREVILVVASFKSSDGALLSKSLSNLYSTARSSSGAVEIAFRFPHVKDAVHGSSPFPDSRPGEGLKSSRVHVGRHEILVRSWPHPNPLQTLVANRLMDIVQEEQRHTYGLKQRKQLIVVTPTYVRALQAAHLTSLIHTLRIVPGPMIWIVVEAGGVSNETATVLSTSQLSFHHLGLAEATMPVGRGERRQLVTRLRLEGLRFVKQQRLDGIVVFADDSNTYSLEFFDEVQKIQWMGAFSIGLFPHSGEVKVSKATNARLLVAGEENDGSSPSPLLQGPSCNATGHVVGWYVPIENKSLKDSGLFQTLQWAGFAFNARLLWEEHEQPAWLKTWQGLFGGNRSHAGSLFDFVKSALRVEPLGNCGRNELLWWLRLEAHDGSDFPSKSVFICE